MGASTGIAWCDATVNLWWGCQEVAPECDDCFARAFAKRVGKGRAWQDVRYEVPGAWKLLDKLQASAAKAGRPLTVFVQSMADIFERNQQLVTWQGRFTGTGTHSLRWRFFSDVQDGRWPDLVFLLLTKRPGLIRSLVTPIWRDSWPRNVWTGTSVGTKQSLAQIDRLVSTPGPHFVSFEPLLEPLGIVAATPPDWDAFEEATIGQDGWQEPEEFVEECEDECDWVNYGRGLVHSREHKEWLRDREDLARILSLGRRIQWAIIGCESKGPRVGRLGPDGTEAGWADLAASLVGALAAARVATFVKQVPVGGRVSHDPAEWDERLRRREFPEWVPRTEAAHA